DQGEPPTVGVVAPAADAVVHGTETEVHLTTTGTATDYYTTIHYRELTAADDFSVVVLPDTQYYTTGPTSAHPDRAIHFFADQTRWIMSHRDDYRIRAVIHNGDIVDDGRVTSQWTVA